MTVAVAVALDMAVAVAVAGAVAVAVGLIGFGATYPHTLRDSVVSRMWE